MRTVTNDDPPVRDSRAFIQNAYKSLWPRLHARSSLRGMAVDRAAARQRVAVITGWAAAGAAAMTAAFAVAGARANHTATQPATSAVPTPTPQDSFGGGVDPSQGQGNFTPPSESDQPPQATSGGS